MSPRDPAPDSDAEDVLDLDTELDTPIREPVSPVRLTLLFGAALLLITLGAALWMATLTSLSAGVAVFLLLFTFSLFLLVQYHSAITRFLE